MSRVRRRLPPGSHRSRPASTRPCLTLASRVVDAARYLRLTNRPRHSAPQQVHRGHAHLLVCEAAVCATWVKAGRQEVTRGPWEGHGAQAPAFLSSGNESCTCGTPHSTQGGAAWPLGSGAPALGDCSQGEAGTGALSASPALPLELWACSSPVLSPCLFIYQGGILVPPPRTAEEATSRTPRHGEPLSSRGVPGPATRPTCGGEDTGPSRSRTVQPCCPQRRGTPAPWPSLSWACS